MKKIIFKGCGTAIATPFNENGVNLPEFSKLVEEQIKQGVDGIIVCGTTGESATMTEEESLSAKIMQENGNQMDMCGKNIKWKSTNYCRNRFK